MATKDNTVQSILEEINTQQYRPVYFFMGEEPYYIDYLTEYMMDHILREDEREFDQSVLYGKDINTSQVIVAARRYPMLAKYQVLVVKEAQQIRNFEEDFLLYMQQPTPTTILIINYKNKTIDKRKKLAAELNKSAVLFESKKIYDNQVPDWISRYVATQQYQIEPKAAQMMADFLGTDLGRIVGELKKLQIVMPKGQTSITAELVEKNIGISKDFNNFELVDAIKVKDVVKAHQIAIHFAKDPKDNPMVVTLITLFDFFSKLLVYLYLVDKSSMNAASQMGVPPFTVRNYETAAKYYNARKVLENISLIREFDAKVKGYGQTSVDDGELLRELLCRLMA